MYPICFSAQAAKAPLGFESVNFCGKEGYARLWYNALPSNCFVSFFAFQHESYACTGSEERILLMRCRLIVAIGGDTVYLTCRLMPMTPDQT